MKEKPMVFNILAVIVTLVAAGFPLQIMWQFGHLPYEFSSIVSKLAPLNIIVIVFSLVNGFAYYNVSPWIVLSAPVYILLVLWNNTVTGMQEVNATLSVSMISWAALTCLHAPLLKKNSIKAIRVPEACWWKTEPRKRISVSTVIEPAGGISLAGNTFDLSSGGAFFPADKNLSGFKVGDQCSIKLKLEEHGMVHCRAKVVRMAEKRGKYPAGFGLQFLFDENKSKKILSRYLNSNFSHAGAAA